MEQQQIVEGDSNIEQDINNIFDSFEYIRNNINGELPQIPQDSIVLIFLGEFGQKFHTFYQHFQIQQVVLNTKYYKLIRIEKQGKISFLFNFPLILQYDDQNAEIILNLCISKIYAEKAIQKMQDCKFYLIVDVNQLNGDDDKAKVNNTICDCVFQFGEYYFKDNQFLFLRQKNEDEWNFSIIQKNSSKNQQNQQECDFKLDSKVVKPIEVLKSIFNAKSSSSQVKVNFVDDLNYGKMKIYICEKQNLLTKQFNDLLKKFQKHLLTLQQMPIIQNQDDTNQKVGNYLTELYKGFNENGNPLTHNFADISKGFTFLNKVNKGNTAIELNDRIQQNNCSKMKQFFEDNKINIESIIIQPFFNDEVQEKLNKIIDFLNIFHKTLFYTLPIVEVQNLEINLSFWSQYCHEKIENILYELNYIVKRIQEGPKDEIENGVYFIGVTKSGKSTIINSILNPDKVIVEDIFCEECFEVEKGFDTKFKIGQGGVSETQKISGIYTGKKEELYKFFYDIENNQNFNQQEEQDVFSYEELLDKGLNNQYNIPENWYIFDCPGFDDNSNEFMRIAHRISLYNYFKKTKNIIVYFIIDISLQQVENIKNTFDPIYYLLKNKNDIQQNFKDWSNLILTKAKKNLRQKYLQDWDLAYKGQLEQNYGFYKQLFADDKRCLEFLRPSKEKEMNKEINQFAKTIIQTTTTQFQQKNQNLSFEFSLDEKVLTIYKKCMPKIQIKLEQLLKLFNQDLDQYLIQSNDTIQNQKQQIQTLQDCFLNQETNQIMNVINLNNYISILKKLSKWIKGNLYTQKIFFFLEAYIQDIKSILKISEYCEDQNIFPFKVQIDGLIKKIKNILNFIQEVEKCCQDYQQKFYGVIFVFFLPIVGFSSQKGIKMIEQLVRQNNYPLATLIKYLLRKKLAQIVTATSIKLYFIYHLPKLAYSLFPEGKKTQLLKEKSQQYISNEQQELGGEIQIKK